jgi:hypothetical protein
MKRLFISLLLITAALQQPFAQGIPDIVSWIVNTNNTLGYSNISANCQTVQFDSNNLYISCTDIPAYHIGPWPSDPNVPSNQGFVWKITRNPVKNPGSPVVVGLGHIGVLTNGVSIFNSQDANSYNNLGYWHQNAYYFESVSFDSCNGHPAPGGELHNHINPRCLYNDADSTQHSPIIGFAFDGFPIYGPYGYANPNGSGGIKRMRASYQKRNMVNRDTLPNGTVLSAADYGPTVSASYPLGDYVEDYKYIAASGDLDTNNGRVCITPEYPSGTYAYFVTIDASLKPVYPYFIGLTYYGTVQTGNTGPGSGHNTIPTGTKTYIPPAGVNEVSNTLQFKLEPNPVTAYAYLHFAASTDNNIKATLYNSIGQVMETFTGWHSDNSYRINMTAYPSGMYFLHLQTDKTYSVLKIMKIN